MTTMSEKSWSKQVDDGLQLTIVPCPPIDNQLTLIAAAATVVVTAGATRKKEFKSGFFSEFR